MKKLKIIFLAVIIIAGMCFNGLAKDVTYPNIRGHVNDFANILSEEAEKEMGDFLINYEKETSIEIVVVTTPSLGGLDIADWTMGLVSRKDAKEWHIGKKGADNGLAVVIAPKERKTRIEVGYGLEGEITDLVAGRIISNQMAPAFKKGEMAKGINNALQDITQKLGYSSAKERTTRKHLAREESKRKMKEVGTTGAIISALIAFVYAIYRGIKSIKAYFAERKRKRELRIKVLAQLKSLEGFRESIQEQTDRFNISADNTPPFVDNIVKVFVEKIYDAVVLLDQVVKDAYAQVKDNPDSAQGLVENEGDNLRAEIINYIKKAQEALNGFTEQRLTATNTLSRIKDTLDAIKTDLASAIEQGFTFHNLGTGLEKDFESLATRLGSDSTGKESDIRSISNAIENLLEEVEAEHSMITSITSNKKKIDEAIPLLATRKVVTARNLEEAKEVLVEIVAENPKSVWVEVGQRLGLIPDELLNAEILLSQARKDGSMEEQEVTDALSHVKAVRQIIDESDLAIQAVEDLRENIAEAKRKQPKLLRDAKKRLKSASKFANNGDVNFARQRRSAKIGDPNMSLKQKLDRAKAELKEAQRMAKDELVDWIYLSIILSLVISLSAEVIKHAETDILAVKKERARIKAKEEKRKRERYSYGGYSSSSSFSSGGGFSGGGGGFGGGGASGSW